MLTVHFKMFNDKVKLMNHLNGKTLTLSAAEARNLHSDLFDLLNQHAAVVEKTVSIPTVESNTLQMDGGNF